MGFGLRRAWSLMLDVVIQDLPEHKDTPSSVSVTLIVSGKHGSSILYVPRRCSLDRGFHNDETGTVALWSAEDLQVRTMTSFPSRA